MGKTRVSRTCVLFEEEPPDKVVPTTFPQAGDHSGRESCPGFCLMKAL